MNLTDAANVLTAQIKIENLDSIKKKTFHVTQSDSYMKLQYTIVGTHILSKYGVLFKKCLSRLPKPIELLHKHVKTNFKYHKP